MEYMLKVRLYYMARPLFLKKKSGGPVFSLIKLTNVGEFIKHIWEAHLGYSAHAWCQSSDSSSDSSACHILKLLLETAAVCLLVYNLVFLSLVLLTAKSVAGRCIRFAFYTMTSFGLQGAWFVVISGTGERLCISHGGGGCVPVLFIVSKNSAIKGGGSWF